MATKPVRSAASTTDAHDYVSPNFLNEIPPTIMEASGVDPFVVLDAESLISLRDVTRTCAYVDRSRAG
jgi:hypothetical protein